MSFEGFEESYRRRIRRKRLVIAIMLVLAAVAALLEIALGPYEIGFGEAYRVFFDHLTGVPIDNATDEYLVWEKNAPRGLAVFFVGAGLGICGAAMQSALRNPLADPYTTGISSGAVLGANIAIVLGLAVVGLGQYGPVLNAFLFSLIPAGVMIFVSRISSGSPVTIILVGTAVSYIFSAFSTLIMMVADDDAMQEAYEWQVGSLSGASWSYLPMMFTVTLVGGVALYAMSGRLNLLMMGDNDAKALGLNVDNFRMICLIIVSFVTASIVSFVGMIGFLGLIAPHMVRLILGSDTFDLTLKVQDHSMVVFPFRSKLYTVRKTFRINPFHVIRERSVLRKFHCHRCIDHAILCLNRIGIIGKAVFIS